MLSRKSLIDHLFTILWDHLSLSDFEACWFCRDGKQACSNFEKWLKSKNTKESPKRLESIEDSRLIIGKIKSIISDNECGTEFEAGILFGRLTFAIEDFENYVWNLESIRQRHFDKLLGDYHERLIDEAIDQAENELDKWYEATSKELAIEGKEPPSEEEISEKHNQLMSIFGERVCDLLSDWDEDDLEEFRPIHQVKLDAAISSLLNSQLIKRCTHATTALNEIRKNDNLLTLDATEEPDTKTYLTSRIGTVKPIAKVKMSVWLAFGEVLGVLREIDDNVFSGDASSAISRSFRLLPTDTPDKVHEKLLRLENELSNDPSIEPEEIVNRLQCCIEAIVRRVWPNEFSSCSYKGELNSILHNHRNSSHCNDLNSRFANVALTLLKSYRNPQQHQMEAFECSYEESRFFLAGIRALVDLWKKIKLAQN